MPKVSAEHRAARRDEILDAARACFLRNGFHASTMQDVFAESGLSAGAVYLYFAGKEEIVRAIALEAVTEIGSTLGPLVDAPGERCAHQDWPQRSKASSTRSCPTSSGSSNGTVSGVRCLQTWQYVRPPVHCSA